MTKKNDQEQTVTEGSTAIQAGGDVTITNTGLTLTEVRDVAKDIFDANFYKLQGAAQATASARAEEVTEKFLEKLQLENPDESKKRKTLIFSTRSLRFRRNTPEMVTKILVTYWSIFWSIEASKSSATSYKLFLMNLSVPRRS